MSDKEKKKRKHLPPRGDVKPAVTTSVPNRVRLGAGIDEREEFGENTFAGALEAVKSVLKQASASEAAAAKGRKKGSTG